MGGIIVLIVVVILLIIVLGSAIKIIHQQRVGLVERLGKFQRTIGPGPHLVIPIADKVRYNIDMREAVVPFPPQGVITEDNLMVSIDSVIYFQVIDPVRAAYEAQDYIRAIEQLTMTTLRNIIGGLDLEQTLTSREEINGKLRVVLDEATGKWGIKVNRVELRAIEPPPTIRDAMEKGARAERDKRASILLAEGQRQSQILSAGGEKESAILRAQGDREAAVLRAQADRQSQMLRAEGEAQAISTVFNAIHAGQPDQALLSYQYMQMMPQIARGDANKVWVVPSEIGKALEGLGGAFGQGAAAEGKEGSGIPARIEGDFKAPEKIDVQAELVEQKKQDDAEADKRVQEAIAAAQELEREPGGRRGGSALRSDQKAALGIGPDQPAAPQFDAPGGPAEESGSQPQQGQQAQQQGANPFLPPAGSDQPGAGQAGPQHQSQQPPFGPSSQPTPPAGPPPQQ
ncbi:SPFH domain-containing protein [Microlunatus soli]|uniref:Regulator of protease activity HflC, stomatin/prohibitin superfamily n=1 Tax=Microlunatus soli TaxID=630515 RepID=A0A1H1P0H5_9ACTN|nr:SPFH domain-containing protein [Microlunatus soli]SDS04694.1 Regulator of protease activity HflC, stomatin/prohibitin superfamily [Microlunatus soli]